jgi:hypothetical protein
MTFFNDFMAISLTEGFGKRSPHPYAPPTEGNERGENLANKINKDGGGRF